MLRRTAAVLVMLSVLVVLFPAPNAEAKGGICQKLANAGAANNKIDGWALRKCPKHNSGTGTSDSTSKKKTRKCPVMVVRLADGTCPEPEPGDLPHLPHEFGRLVPIEESVVAALTLPEATPRFGPDPSVNEWKMLAVGFPIWLWTDGPRQLRTHVRRGGLGLAITATWQSTQFTMGDGQTKGCAAMTQYPPHLDHPGESSPTCGYVYEVASPIGHPYVVTARERWLIEWSSGGDRGSFVHSYEGSRTLEVGELMSLIKG